MLLLSWDGTLVLYKEGWVYLSVEIAYVRRQLLYQVQGKFSQLFKMFVDIFFNSFRSKYSGDLITNAQIPDTSKNQTNSHSIFKFVQFLGIRSTANSCAVTEWSFEYRECAYERLGYLVFGFRMALQKPNHSKTGHVTTI